MVYIHIRSGRRLAKVRVYLKAEKTKQQYFVVIEKAAPGCSMRWSRRASVGPLAVYIDVIRPDQAQVTFIGAY